MVANSSNSSSSDEDEDFNVPRKSNYSLGLNASEEIVGNSSVDKLSGRKRIVEDSDDQSILEVSDHLVVNESLEIVENEEVVDVHKKTRSLGDSKSVTFLDVDHDVTSLMEAEGKLQISSPDKNVS